MTIRLDVRNKLALRHERNKDNKKAAAALVKLKKIAGGGVSSDEQTRPNLNSATEHICSISTDLEVMGLASTPGCSTPL